MPKWTWGNNDKPAKDIFFTLSFTFRLPIPDLTEKKEICTHVLVEQMPSFPEGEKAMFKFISDNIQYPEEYNKACIQGKVAVRFLVTKECKLESPQILRSLDPLLDKEALRIISIMPDWILGKQNGEDIDVYFTLPIVFKLSH